jgi:ureidoacrylate peracid hydrolase
MKRDGEGALLDRLDLKVDPKHCALLVIDVQNDFAATGGFFHQVGADVGPIQREVVPAIGRLIDAARRVGVTVIFVKSHYDSQYLSPPMRERNARLGMTMSRCLSGSWGAEFYEVKPIADEPVVIKHRYSAMIGTSLREVLQARGIQSLLLSGIATDTCVESTARDAYFLDYYVTLVSDCCGAASAQDHNGTFPRFTRDYGLVVTSDSVTAIWSGLDTARATAQVVDRSMEKSSASS